MVYEYLVFEHPEALAAGVFIILFVVSHYVIVKFIRNKGIALIVSFLIAGIAAWKLYSERFYGWEGTLAFVLIVAVIVIIIKIFFSFFKGARKGFGKY